MAGEDWAGVSNAITQRMTELHLTQSDLITRSHISKATVGELQHNSAQRRRSIHTLEALSLALDWHPDHLHAILNRRRPPAPDAPVIRPDTNISARLAVIEDQLDHMINTHSAGLAHLSEQIAALNTTIEHLTHHHTPAHDEHHGR